jgi:hypothetical protein
MLHKPYILDHPLRYPPAGKLKKAMVRWLTRSVVG